MGNAPNLSCILITCNSDVDKGNSVYHVITSILNQDYYNFELIIIENSSNKRLQRCDELNEFIRAANQKRLIPIEFKVISYKNQLNVNIARNRASKLATSGLLLFVEDDTIINGVKTFSKIYKYSKHYDFGFGAKRNWTKIGWFQQSSDTLLDSVKKNDYSPFASNSGSVPSEYKGKDDGDFFDTIQGYSFIANFGFVKTEAFKKANGFPLYKGLDLSDDCLMYRLFNLNYKFGSLSEFSVFHVSHFRKRNNSDVNLKKYFRELIKDGNYWSHTYNALIPDNDLTNIIEPLKSLHYDYRLSDMYKDYCKSMPINIEDEIIDYKEWKSVNALDLLDFAIIVSKLIKSSSLNVFVKSSRSDFDNLAMIIHLAIKYNLITIDLSGAINNSKVLKDNRITKIKHKALFKPNKKLNQFPCDKESKYRKANLFLDRYPFAEYLRFAIIGDDDFISLYFQQENIIPIVIETDSRITDLVSKFNSNALVFKTDLTDEKTFLTAKIPTIKTFITDPPYTYHGALLFILRGLMLLSNDKDIKEFYVILNEQMLGKNFLKLQNTLSLARIYLYKAIDDFCQYEIPENFDERTRANKFLNAIKVSNQSVKYSSSSNLYIFRTVKPNIAKLTKEVDVTKIYNLYAKK